MTTTGKFTGHTKPTRVVELEENYDRHKRLANCLTHDLATVTDAEMHMAVSVRINDHLSQCRRLAKLLQEERGY
jgi:hypothetical protein